MRSGDFLWLAGLGVIALVLVLPDTRQSFVALSTAYPYMMGFAKFVVLATMGELLALRISVGQWRRPAGLWMRAVVWGVLGMAITLMFQVFSTGVVAAIGKGMLPGGYSVTATFVTAFLISTVMNLAFAPTFMALHRITDTYIDLADGKLANLARVELKTVMSRIDWHGFVSFVVIRTLPLFWIPAHTVTFLLPPEFRVLMAAFLSIALGGDIGVCQAETPVDTPGEVTGGWLKSPSAAYPQGAGRRSMVLKHQELRTCSSNTSSAYDRVRLRRVLRCALHLELFNSAPAIQGKPFGMTKTPAEIRSGLLFSVSTAAKFLMKNIEGAGYYERQAIYEGYLRIAVGEVVNCHGGAAGDEQPAAGGLGAPGGEVAGDGDEQQGQEDKQFSVGRCAAHQGGDAFAGEEGQEEGDGERAENPGRP